MKAKKKLPIFWEIIKSSFLIITLILTIYTIAQVIIFGIFTSDYEADLVMDTYREINDLSNDIGKDVSEDAFYEHLTNLENRASEECIRIYSHDKVYYQTQYNIWSNIKNLYRDNYITIEYKLIDFERYILITGPIQIGEFKCTIQIIAEADMLEKFIESSLPTLAFILILGLILSAVGAMYLSKNFINRLRNLISTMEEVKKNGLNNRVNISGLNDEVDKVNIVFNSMMDELEDVFDEQSRFVADASHELKTPLTALQGHLSMLKRWGKHDEERLDKSLDICLREVKRLKKIVDDMLVLSKSEKNKIDLNNLDEIDPRLIIDEVIDQYRILNSNVKYSVNIEDNIKIKIDPNDLKQLLVIFIDNAIKYNNKDNIEIKIALNKEYDKVKLEVIDNGMGISEDEIKNVMKRFYKVDKSRVHNNSFGIGLSIADRIINNYNGSLNIESELDKYTSISIYFKN